MIAGRNRVYISLGGALPENKTLRAEVARWAKVVKAIGFVQAD